MEGKKPKNMVWGWIGLVALVFIGLPIAGFILDSLPIKSNQSSMIYAHPENTSAYPTLFRPTSIPYSTSTPTNIPTIAYTTKPKNTSVPIQSPTSKPINTPIPQLGCPNGCAYHPNGCDIKGNISYNTGEKIYHLVGMSFYKETVINPDYGERWFCTEQEAINNGWRKAKN